MGVDLEVPGVQYPGICLDCDGPQLISQTGCCAICGSHSVIRRGAIAELERLIKVRDREARRETRRARKK